MSRAADERLTHERLIEAALARLPEWQPPPGFADRVARVAVRAGESAAGLNESPASGDSPAASHWLHLLPRGLSIAVGVSVAAWLSAELMVTGLKWMAGSESAAVMAWLLAAGSLAGVWRLVRRNPLSRITS